VLLRHWWLVVIAVVLLLLGVGVGAVAWDRHKLRGSEDTVSVLLELRRHDTGLATISVRRGRLADPGPFAERVAGLLAPTAHRSPPQIYGDLLDRFQMINVSLSQLVAPLRLDTRALQQALALGGFRRLEVGLIALEHWQVVPASAARAGGCWGNALSCEWRLATAGPPVKIVIRPAWVSAHAQPFPPLRYRSLIDDVRRADAWALWRYAGCMRYACDVRSHVRSESVEVEAG
jgi:hypothetical protein